MNPLLEENKKEFEKELAYHQELLKMGMLTQGEFDSWLQGRQILPFQYIRERGYICPDSLSVAQWEQLQEDYALWQAGKPYSSAAENEWLTVKTNERNLSVEQMKTEFFESRHSLLMGIADLEPVPASIECSGMFLGMPNYYPKTPQWLLFDSKELIHLFERPDEALGNTYQFTMKNGIFLQMKIEQKGKTRNPKIIVLEGKGYLSEYMMPLDHALTLRYSFENPPRYPVPQIEFCFLSNEDLRFYYDSPRFQPYFAFLRARRERAWHETQKLYTARYGK